MSTVIAMKDVMDLDKKGKPSDLGYLVYQNNTLEFYKYKALGGSYQVFIYIVVSIIRLFLKEKLMYTITKDQIASISIERGQDIITQGGNTGRFLRAFSNMTGQNTKGPDTLIVTMKNNETYKFIVNPQTDEAADQISFDDLVVNMGMMLS